MGRFSYTAASLPLHLPFRPWGTRLGEKPPVRHSVFPSALPLPQPGRVSRLELWGETCFCWLIFPLNLFLSYIWIKAFDFRRYPITLKLFYYCSKLMATSLTHQDCRLPQRKTSLNVSNYHPAVSKAKKKNFCRRKGLNATFLCSHNTMSAFLLVNYHDLLKTYVCSFHL